MFRAIIKYLLGLFVISIGINLSVVAELGVSAVNSVPYSISVVSGINFGICIIAIYSFYIFLQFVILRKEFTWKHLMQLACSIVFGQFISLNGMLMNTYIVVDTVIMQYILLFASIFLTAFGISLYVQADLIFLPVEGLADAITRKTRFSFSNVRTALDVSFVTISVCIGMIFIGTIVGIGIGIGTIISAFTVGKLLPFTDKIAIKIL